MGPLFRPAAGLAGLFLVLSFGVAPAGLAGAGSDSLLQALPAEQPAAAAAEWSSRTRARKAQPRGQKRPAAKKSPAAQAADKPVIVPRQQFSARDQARAAIPGIAGARFWADSPKAFLEALPSVPGPWLVLSTGGEDGAYGAGLLAGWSAARTRPDFALVTGVSTGALMAPFVFAGRKYDGDLRAAYTTISAIDIFEVGGRGESLLDTWPLKDLVARQMTRELLADIATEHERGRRLFVLTTNLDAGRPVAWDIGAIAARRNQQALDLVRSILMAAISVPGAFPPVLIEAEADGTHFHEMHVDGGLGAQFYVTPDALQASTSSYRLPASDLYIIVNMKLAHDFEVTERSLIGILGRTVSAAIRVVTRNAIDRAYVLSRRSGVPFHLAFIDDVFSAPSRGAFDPDYMKTLFEFGYALGKSGTAFHNEPPGLADTPMKAAQ